MSAVRATGDGRNDPAITGVATPVQPATGQETRPATGHEALHRPAAELGTGELVRQATQQASDLVRAELRLAAAELKDKGKHAGRGAGLFGAAGLLALYGTGALLTAVIAAIALALPVWAAALIVGAALVIIAAILAALGRTQTSQATPPTPGQAVETAKQAVAEIRERAHR